MPGWLSIGLAVLGLAATLPALAMIPRVLRQAAGPRLAAGSAAFLALWVAAALGAGWTGSPLPWWTGMVLLAGLFAAGLAWVRSESAGRAARLVPPHMPVIWQVARAVGGLSLVGAAGGSWAGAAGLVEFLFGISAIPVGLAYRSKPRRERRLGIVWNLLGIASFALAIGLAVTTRVDRTPYVTYLLGGFVPVAVLVHLFSMRNLPGPRRKGGSKAKPAVEAA